MTLVDLSLLMQIFFSQLLCKGLIRDSWMIALYQYLFPVIFHYNSPKFLLPQHLPKRVLLIDRWHFSSFNFMWLHSNHSRAIKESCSNLFITLSRLMSRGFNLGRRTANFAEDRTEIFQKFADHQLFFFSKNVSVDI